MSVYSKTITAQASLPAQTQPLECYECGLSQCVPAIPHKHAARCPRCGASLGKHHINGHQRSLAFALAALVLLLVSLPFEFLRLNGQGQENAMSLLSSATSLVEQDFGFLAVLQVLAVIAFPLLVLACIIYLQAAVISQRHLSGLDRVFRVLFAILPWCMAEIFLLGVLVSLIKVSELAQLSLGSGFIAYGLFTLCMLAAIHYLDKHQLQYALDQQLAKRHIQPPRLTPRHRSRSLQFSWALLLTSVILYLPANLLPIMNTQLLGNEQPSTIIGGVRLLWQDGSYVVASIIVAASVVVPIVKLLILGWLILAVQWNLLGNQQARTRWYRIVEAIGRWSMVDVFVVAILVSLIQLDSMTVYPGPAAVAFSLVVILTMLAAITFDTRLLWKDVQNEHAN